MCVQLIAELASYPLLVVATRLAVIESGVPLADAVYFPRRLSLSSLSSFLVELATCQVVVGASEMFYLTLHADGFGAFWRGAFPFLLSRSVDEAITTLFFFTGRRSSSSSNNNNNGWLYQQQQQQQQQLPAASPPPPAAAAAVPQQQLQKEEETSVDRRMQQLEEYTMRAWFSGKRF